MLQLLILIMIHLPAFAKDSVACMFLLDPATAPADNFKYGPDATELTQVQLWLADHGKVAANENEARDAFSEWDRLKSATKKQRNANLALELKRISPPNETALVSLDGRAQLEALSKTNLARMTEKLELRYPQVAVLLNDHVLQPQSRSVSQLLKFAYSVDRPMRSDDGVNPPIVSPRQLHKLSLIPKKLSIYSWLVGASPSAEFDVKIASPKAMAPSAIYLRQEIASQQGFAIPQFEIIENLLLFFQIWDPEALDLLYAHNRLSFPSHVNSGKKMLEYFHEGAVDPEDVFPATAPEKLSVLRERLIGYVLTEADSREFIRRAFQLWILQLKTTNISLYDQVVSGLYGTMGPNDLRLRDFYNFSGIPGMSLRLPVVSNAGDYSIERDIPKAEQFRYGMPFELVDHMSPTGRGPRLDHNSIP